jgi:protein gp37
MPLKKPEDRYWDEGVMLVQGCTKCSPGCDNCWSIPLTRRFQHEHKIAEGKNWTGLIRTRPDMLKRFNTRKPKVFAIWNDLFHEDVPFEFIDNVIFMIRGEGHTYSTSKKNIYLILTKRVERMLGYFAHSRYISRRYNYHPWTNQWPLDNVYFGLTICNRQEADEKIPIFLQVPGKKFLSIEPMLGEINLTYLPGEKIHSWGQSHHVLNALDKIDAVILGGETGTGARPMHPDWVRSVRDQCAAAGVPFFFKQWGEWAPDCLCSTKKPHKDTPRPQPGKMGCMFRCGNKAAGRLLDRRTHDDLPWRNNGLK